MKRVFEAAVPDGTMARFESYVDRPFMVAVERWDRWYVWGWYPDRATAVRKAAGAKRSKPRPKSVVIVETMEVAK